MAESLTKNASKFILRELIGDVLLFPLWWYVKGLARFSGFCWNKVGEFTNRSRLSPKVWFQNLFVPMYGDYSRSGRAISFFVRLVVALALSVVFVIYLVGFLIFFLAYLALPVAVVYYFLRQLINLPWFKF
ncbi:MAG: hypothetical protein COT26_02320 [Candidatus Kerfeldbacteria bacterium CG08_land_8_20_14_0_20_43_14]|uniref:Uncharacterized protein n=1 Tax=Candidatus Kerfeldbacteria bacterium CG08_land_8_20_14_0_20_43_14 TaxID=2014246 RepID=A0A2H0YQ74_9BACT|nr:MAG: hypothetical protein COT26_02320 [Candidatus Kerfeldbacteria bacterium CG08_land_8_20_14_0_20_43_14]